MPEYVYSLASDGSGVWVNLFAASSLSFNATVAAGSGGGPSPATAPPTPPPSGVVPPPPPPMSWQLLEKDAYWPGDHNPGNNPTGAQSLEQCKASCVASSPAGGNSYYSCMGITWKNGSAASNATRKPLCSGSGCELLEVSPLGSFFAGSYSQTGTSNVSSLGACKAACMADAKCAQLTWVVRPADPCVLYSAIYANRQHGPGVQGWVKCAAGSKDAASCAAIQPGEVSAAQCQQFQSIDMSHQVRAKGPSKSPGTEQWMVVGRQIHTQHDFTPRHPAAALGAGTSATPVGGRSVTEAQLTMTTEFPYSNDVQMTMSWPTKSVSAVAVNLRLRIPGWMGPSGNLSVHLNGAPYGSGAPGSFLEIRRDWSQNDLLSFTLPELYTLSLYTGIDQIHGSQRYALKVGPIVMACVGQNGGGATPLVPLAASNVTIKDWLIPVPGKALNFQVKGAPSLQFVPMWEVPSSSRFTTYPIFKAPSESKA